MIFDLSFSDFYNEYPHIQQCSAILPRKQCAFSISCTGTIHVRLYSITYFYDKKDSPPHLFSFSHYIWIFITSIIQLVILALTIYSTSVDCFYYFSSHFLWIWNHFIAIFYISPFTSSLFGSNRYLHSFFYYFILESDAFLSLGTCCKQLAPLYEQTPCSTPPLLLASFEHSIK